MTNSMENMEEMANMKEITKDTFYDFIGPYDLDDEYFFVGEVDDAQLIRRAHARCA